MEVFTSSYEYQSLDGGASVRRAIADLAPKYEGRITAWVAVTYENDLDFLVPFAVEANIMGPGFIWLYSDGSPASGFSSRGRGGTKYTSDTAGYGLNGSFRISAVGGIRQQDKLGRFDLVDKYWAQLDANTEWIQYLESKALKVTADRTTYFLPGQDLSSYTTAYTNFPAGQYFAKTLVSAYLPFYHDASVMFGLAACRVFTNGGNPADAASLMAAMRVNQFEGFSGTMKISETFSREPSSTIFNIENMALQPDKSLKVSQSASYDSVAGVFSSACFGCGNFQFSTGTDKPPLQKVAPPTPPRECDESDYGYVVSECSKDGTFVLSFEWKETTVDEAIDGTPLHWDGLCKITDVVLPTTTKMDCDYVSGDSTIGVLLIIVASVGVGINVLFLVLTIMLRKKPIFVLSQPIFIGIMILGAALCCVTNYLNFSKMDDKVCENRVWLMNVFFTLLFTPLLVKTYRIHRIMNNKKLKKVSISNLEVLRLLSMFILVELGILIAWHFVDPVHMVSEPVQSAAGYNVIANYYAEDLTTELVLSKCSDKTGKFGMLILAYKAVYVAYGCYLGWKTRSFDSSLAETKFVMAAMYQMFVLGIITLLLFGMGISAQARAILQCFSTVFGSCGTVVLVVVPKLPRLSQTHADIARQNSTSAGLTNNTSSSSSGKAGATATSGNEGKAGGSGNTVAPEPGEVDALYVKISELQAKVMELEEEAKE